MLIQTEKGSLAGPVAEFLRTPTEDIVRMLKEMHPDSNRQEVVSWQNSIPVLLSVLEKGNFGHLWLILEDLIYDGKRIDAVLIGHAGKDDRPLALIIEMKQWEAFGVNERKHFSRVPVVVSKQTGAIEYREHPVQQTLTYRKQLEMGSSAVLEDKFSVGTCQFLHNLTDLAYLFSGYYKQYANLRKYCFGKNDFSEFAAWIGRLFSDRFADKHGITVENLANKWINSGFTMSYESYRALVKVMHGEENAALIEDEIEVNTAVWTRILKNMQMAEPRKQLTVIHGGPGTGKTVVGLHVIYAYVRQKLCENHITLPDTGEIPDEAKKIIGSCCYSLARNKALRNVMNAESGIAAPYSNNSSWSAKLVVIDEAHRMKDPIGDLNKQFRHASNVVVLQDDFQRILYNDRGTAEFFRWYAGENQIEITEHELTVQKRTGFGSGYVDCLNQMLYGNRTIPFEDEFHSFVRFSSSLHEIDKSLKALRRDGHHTKWAAPYCWNWGQTNIPDIQIGNFTKFWNPAGDSSQWFLGKTEDDLEQVACVYTVQGLEIEHMGLIWWDDLRWDPRQEKWVINLDLIHDTELIKSLLEPCGKFCRRQAGRWVLQDNPNLSVQEFLQQQPGGLEAAEQLIKNIYRILLSRPLRSITLWFKDPETEKHVRSLFSEPADIC